MGWILKKGSHDRSRSLESSENMLHRYVNGNSKGNNGGTCTDREVTAVEAATGIHESAERSNKQLHIVSYVVSTCHEANNA